MKNKSYAEEVLEEYETRSRKADREIESRELKIFNECIDAIDSSEHILETIFQFIRTHHDLIPNLTLNQWLALKNHYRSLYESITFLVVVLEIAKNIPQLLIKEFTLFVTHIIHKHIDNPVTGDDFYRYKYEDIFYGRAEKIISQNPDMKDQVMALYNKQLDERLLLTHDYMSGTLRIRLDTQSRLTGISAPYRDAAKDSNLFRSDLEERQKVKLKEGMTEMAHTSYASIRRMKVFLQYIYATEKENFAQSTGAQALTDRVSFYVANDKEKALNYLEQAKSALFLERLSFRTPFPEHLYTEELRELIQTEQRVKKEVETIFATEKVADFDLLRELAIKRKKLDDLYSDLTQYPHPAIKEYIDLRKGLPIQYKDLKVILTN
jgi:hypothetical protein